MARSNARTKPSKPVETRSTELGPNPVWFKPVMFGSGAAPTEDRIRHVVGTAVRTFLAAYAKR